jgi:DNA invertase Pin-like site-specific DNA recombinase
MSHHSHHKVSAVHLKRDAYLYIRQSTLRQVVENTESTERQYALRQRAVALGWPLERVVVIDTDLGQSAASAADREGFRKLVAEGSVGRAGIVLGLEVSRLARNCTDWHRLLEICALTDTLILDEDGLYDPGQFNDRLLLGLKGTMSEAELHLLRARLQGGIRNKARRGELQLPLPVGLVYDPQGRVTLDPDQQVQQAVRAFFSAYERTGSACGVVRSFGEQGLLFPRRLRRGLRKGELVWGPLTHSRALQVLHNPRYAGAFAFGRTRMRNTGEGRVSYQKLPQDEWHTLIPAAHPGYITWEQYQEHQRRLRAYAQAHGLDRRKSPPGEGPALLQGLVMCGVCGQRMTVHYHSRNGSLQPNYVCQRDGIEHAQPICQDISGAGIDAAIGELMLEMLQPHTLELAWAVQHELQARLEEADQLRRRQVERARYEAELAEHRFMRVDPNHRLVADELEADWNAKLRALAQAQEQYEQQRQADRGLLDENTRAKVLSLATDFPRLWSDPKTPDRERKRMVRLLIEDVTLTKAEQITAHVRFRGGATRSLRLPIPLPAGEGRKTSHEVLSEIDRLLENHGETEIAAELNRRGYRSGTGGLFTPRLVKGLRYTYALKTRYDRLREAGTLTLDEMAQQLGITPGTVKIWRRHGLLKGHPYNDKGEYLYEPLGDNPPVKTQGRKLAQRRRFPQVTSNRTDEVQHEA